MSSPPPSSSAFAEVDPFTQQSSPASSTHLDTQPDQHRPSSPPRPTSPPAPATAAADEPADDSPPSKPKQTTQQEQPESQPSYSRAYNLQQAEFAQASIARYLQGETFTIEVRAIPYSFSRPNKQMSLRADSLRPPLADYRRLQDAGGLVVHLYRLRRSHRGSSYPRSAVLLRSSTARLTPLTIASLSHPTDG